MEESGVVKIYSHLATHSRATEMKREVFLKMAKSAYEEIERELGERNRFLAYPYSDHDKVTSEIAKSLGTKLQFVQVTDSRVDGVYYNTVKRVNISYTDDIREVVEAYFK